MYSASVLIPNLHSPWLGEVLAALHQQTVPPLEVIVVGQDRYGLAYDDALVRVIYTPRPVAPAVALNVALAYAQGDVCCFLDADCVPTPDWLEHLLQPYEQGYSVVGGSYGFQPQAYWQRCDNIACAAPFLVTAPRGERTHLTSGNMSVRRAVLRQVGGYDEQFRGAAGEDTELCFRLRAHGYRLYFEPRAIGWHHTHRANWRAVWRHLYTYGSAWPTVVQRHRPLLPPSLWRRLCAVAPLLGALAMPVMAGRDVYRCYSMQPELARRQWRTIIGVWWARLGWYAGVLHALGEPA